MARIFVYKTMGENESLPPPKIDPNYKIEYFFSTTKIAREVTKNTNIQVIFFDFEKEQFSASKIEKLLQILSPLQHIFKIILHPTMAINNPQLRWKYFQYGVNMISADRQQVDNIISTIIQLTTAQNEAILLQNNANNSNNLSNNSNSANNITLTYTCPYCQLSNLPEEPLYTHVEIYHANSPNENFECVKIKFAVHLHGCHGPCVRNPDLSEFVRNKKVIIYSFALAVVRRPDNGKYLLVQEFCNCGYWLPGGRVDPSESLHAAAIRETKEEGGIDIELKGILKIEYIPRKDYVRIRVIFYGEPRDLNQFPKSKPDFESVGATWAAPSDLPFLTLRGSEPKEWIGYLEKGGTIYPMDILSSE